MFRTTNFFTVVFSSKLVEILIKHLSRENEFSIDFVTRTEKIFVLENLKLYREVHIFFWIIGFINS